MGHRACVLNSRNNLIERRNHLHIATVTTESENNAGESLLVIFLALQCIPVTQGIV